MGWRNAFFAPTTSPEAKRHRHRQVILPRLARAIAAKESGRLESRHIPHNTVLHDEFVEKFYMKKLRNKKIMKLFSSKRYKLPQANHRVWDCLSCPPCRCSLVIPPTHCHCSPGCSPYYDAARLGLAHTIPRQNGDLRMALAEAVDKSAPPRARRSRRLADSDHTSIQRALR